MVPERNGRPPTEIVGALLPPGRQGGQAWQEWDHARTATLVREGAHDVRVPLKAAMVRAFAHL